MSERDRGDRPKKSWREMDAARDRAGPRPPRDKNDRPGSSGSGSSSSGGGMDARASKSYRAALDALFAKGEVGKLAEKLSGSPGAARVDPVDVVHGREQKRDSPLDNARGSTGSSSEREAPSTPRAAAPPPEPVKEDGRAPLRKKVLEALGRDEITRAIDKYVKSHGWPNDFEILEQALEHTKEESQIEAMGQLEKLLAKEKPKRSRSLAGKLRFIEETTDAPELRDQAARIRAKL